MSKDRRINEVVVLITRDNESQSVAGYLTLAEDPHFEKFPVSAPDFSSVRAAALRVLVDQGAPAELMNSIPIYGYLSELAFRTHGRS